MSTKMIDESTLPRWRILVRHDRRDLYASLRQSFESDARVRVVLDRRQVNRRVERTAVGTDQRHQQRRRPQTARTLDFWENAGFRLIEEAPPAMKWEYRFEEIYSRETSRLNRLGDEGWEAVSAIARPGSEPGHCLVLFKRPKRDQHAAA